MEISWFRALFSNIPAKLSTSSGIATDFLRGFGNIPVFQYYILLLCSLTQVLSRIGVAYHTKRSAKGTPDEEYRNVEFIRTAFRESMGVTLSYGLVKVLQGMLTSFFKIRLLKDGVPLDKANINIPSSSMYDNFWRRRLHYSKSIALDDVKYPGLFESLKKLGQTWFGKEPAETLLPHHHFKLAFPKVGELDTSVSMSEEIGKSLPGWFNVSFGRLKGFLPKIDNVTFLQKFFDFGPVLIASIPAILLSGYVLEHFNQKHSDQLAKYIADHLGHHKKKAAVLPAVETPQPVPSVPLDSRPAVPYAYNQPMPMTAPTGVGFYGAAYSPVQPNQNPWTWGYSQMSGYGYRPYSPY